MRGRCYTTENRDGAHKSLCVSVFLSAVKQHVPVCICLQVSVCVCVCVRIRNAIAHCVHILPAIRVWLLASVFEDNRVAMHLFFPLFCSD